MRNYEKHVMLNVLDKLWKEHLAAMDYLRQSIGLRGYAQKNPKQEYKRESFEMFSEMLERMKFEVVSILAKVKIQSNEQVEQLEANENPKVENVNYQHAQAGGMPSGEVAAGTAQPQAAAEQQHAPAQPYHREQKKIGRNDPCYCGSGKKYKQCHGKLT
jgi:preprotein translocase subunit SecA